jgi:hypothetical protein
MTYTQDEDLLPEYEFDYGKAQPNRFAERTTITVALQADIGAYLQARTSA